MAQTVPAVFDALCHALGGEALDTSEQAANTVKNSECIIMEEIGHFPMCENPVTFKQY
jgi:pimeloyl-ACP methyl ester carboxylesterase